MWKFIITNATFKMESNESVSVDRMKIIACKSADAVDTRRKK